jgi:hypothetical protein
MKRKQGFCSFRSELRHAWYAKWLLERFLADGSYARRNIKPYCSLLFPYHISLLIKALWVETCSKSDFRFSSECGCSWAFQSFKIHQTRKVLYSDDRQSSWYAWTRYRTFDRNSARSRSQGSTLNKYGVAPEYFPSMGWALIHAVEELFGDEFSDEMNDAWVEAYDSSPKDQALDLMTRKISNSSTTGGRYHASSGTINNGVCFLYNHS